ncbi:MAG: DUF4185 domain-containing protein, partial [Cyanobacteria bacterium]|nr:DUF4185 domain-containing protein [Cyanobacteriota bacterium]
MASLNLTRLRYLCKTSGAQAKSAAGSGQYWSPTLTDPVILFLDATPEMSISCVPGVPGFVALYMPPFSRQIVLRHASTPQGPWSKRIVAYECPESEKN